MGKFKFAASAFGALAALLFLTGILRAMSRGKRRSPA
jgi:hypothetical protein